MKVIIDTDIGDDVDDILALAFALRRPELSVLAITTCVGGVDRRCKMVAKLLSVMGRHDVEIGAGRSLPLVPDEAKTKRLDETPWQGQFADDVPDQEWKDGVQLLLETVDAHPGEIGIITLGPMTNIGAALQADPKLGEKVKFIASMAASAMEERKEYNAWFDPEAVDLVLNSGAHMFLGTWETTRKFTLYPNHEQQIASTQTELAQVLAENIELWRPAQGQKPGPVMYDLAPIVWTFRPELYPTEPHHVSMELDPPQRGKTTITRNGRANVDLCVDVLVDEVLDLYISTILS